MDVLGLKPEATFESKLLILGTVPGAESLRTGRYYANRRNRFWEVLFTVLDHNDPFEYQQRIDLLKQLRIALWDVLHSCDRCGSLDSRIRRGSERPNDMGAFLATHPNVKAILLNGAKAEHLFRRLVASRLATEACIVPLPSTSSANAKLPLAEKITRWRVVRQILDA